MRKQTLVHTYAHIYTCTCVLYLSAVSWGKVDAGKYHITEGIVFMSLSARPCIYMKDNICIHPKQPVEKKLSCLGLDLNL